MTTSSLTREVQLNNDDASRPLEGVELSAHLFRRAGFGATPDELERSTALGYEQTVDELLHPERQPEFDEDLPRRYWPEQSARVQNLATYWMYRMVNTSRPLEEKMTLFWHGLFATSRSKVNHILMSAQNRMLRALALGKFEDILLALSKDPAMIQWLDTKDSDKTNVNENYGRELLELFSMGIGTYTEADVKAASRAFTGWTMKPRHPAQPYGSYEAEFVYREDRHDHADKTFLGETGDWNGEDIIRIIVTQPAAAHFIATKLHAFFVSDTPDESEINELAEVFSRTRGDMRAVMHALLISPWFRSRQHYFDKLKMPIELVVSTVRLTGTDRLPSPEARRLVDASAYMAQEPFNPPSVKGWDGGVTWIDTGLLVERLNFAADELGDPSRPGIAAFVDRVAATGRTVSPDHAVDAAAEFLGPLQLPPPTRESLVQHVGEDGPLSFATQAARDDSARRLAELLQLTSATQAYQFN
jgi:uncharacterized protein (DUF1800 family)